MTIPLDDFVLLTQPTTAMGSDKIEKKRKRASDRHERPSKKTALDPRELPPLAVSVLKDDSELAPVISMSLTSGVYKL